MTIPPTPCNAPNPPEAQVAEGGSAEKEADRDRVRRVLIEPLGALQLLAPKGVTRADHLRGLDTLAGRLGWLDEAQLGILCGLIERQAVAAPPPRWPAVASVLMQARAIAPEPGGDDRIVTSWMRSEAGRRAWAEGPEYALMLVRFLRRTLRPPGPMDELRFRTDADEWRRDRARMARDRRDGVASAAALAELADGDARLEAVRQLVFGEAGHE